MYYVVIRHVRAGTEISKKLTLNPRLSAKIHHFFFSHKWGTRFKHLSKLCPYILMYSALHIMQWFSQLLDVFTPKIKWKFFDFYILWSKTNVAYTRLFFFFSGCCCHGDTTQEFYSENIRYKYHMQSWIWIWYALITTCSDNHTDVVWNPPLLRAVIGLTKGSCSLDPAK